jgi:hypothetical protein
MHDRAEKGLSVRAYCQSAGIRENTYFYWQHKLRDAALAVQEETLPVPKGWATLCTDAGHNEADSLTVEVGGCKIIVRSDTNSELLTKVCRMLKTL